MATNNCVNTYITPDSNNQVIQPSQPAFFAYPNATDNNVTGDGTVVSPVVIDTEVFDQNADFNTATYTFTAPVTGVYLLTSAITFTGAGAATDAKNTIPTSNRTYISQDNGSTASIVSPAGGEITPRGHFADMDAADTAVLSCQVSGMAKTVDIAGGSGAGTDTPTHFGGILVV